MNIVINSITEKIIGCAYEVGNILGHGFLEKVYENALIVELKNSGLQVESQKELKIAYKGEDVGTYYPDILVDSRVIVELKTTKEIEKIHLAQVMNYLRVCNLNYGLVINFGQPKVQVKRVVLT